jgi:hypothetical protein
VFHEDFSPFSEFVDSFKRSRHSWGFFKKISIGMDILRVEGLGIKILKLELKLIKIFEVKLNINITGLLLISQESNKRFEDLDHLFLITFFLVLEISFKSLVDGTNEFFSDVFLCIIIGFFSFLGSSCGLTHCFVLFLPQLD